MNLVEIINTNTKEGSDFFKKLISRGEAVNAKAEEDVTVIVDDVKKRRNEALFAYTKKFDKFDINSDNIKVSKEEIDEAYKNIDDNLLSAIRLSIKRITDFHIKQKQNSWFTSGENGEVLGQLVRPMEKAGVYVPGGRAAYPSSVIMNIVPAKVAGVEQIVMTTPCGADGKIPDVTLVAANEAGVDTIYKAGGAQAIAALAYGTETIPKVNIIVGPGNIYVALAKMKVYGQVAIDSIAGPSEILIIADDSAKADFVAADMLSQAEHDPLASAILVTTSEVLANEVLQELEIQTMKSPRKEIVTSSLNNYGAILVTESLDEAIEISNDYAPEHLEICTKDTSWVFNRIKNAGAIFIGDYSPEPLGDYIAGTNHILPTGRTAKFSSPLSVDHFVKKSSIIHFEKEALKKLSEQTITFAESEGFYAHAESVRIRFKDENVEQGEIK